MKTLFRYVLFSLAVISFSLARCVAASPTARREVLMESPGIEAVYPVDRTHTFVIGPLRRAELSKAFRVVGTYYGGPSHALRAVMIEHDGDEPMIYKSEAPGSLEALRSGSVNLTRAPLSSGKRGYSSIDIFEMATLSCRGGGGEIIYIIPKKYGRFKRLTEVRALEAFQYILMKGSASVWLVACNGKGSARFQVLKNYDFVGDGVETAEFRSGLVLDDVNYVKDESVETARLAELQKRWPVAPASLEGTAREMAAIKRGFVKNISGKRYYGSYRGEAGGGCGDVRLRRLDSGEALRLTVVYEYRVCAGHVSLIRLSKTEESIADSVAVYYSRGGLKMANSD